MAIEKEKKQLLKYVNSVILSSWIMVNPGDTSNEEDTKSFKLFLIRKIKTDSQIGEFGNKDQITAGAKDGITKNYKQQFKTFEDFESAIEKYITTKEQDAKIEANKYGA